MSESPRVASPEAAQEPRRQYLFITLLIRLCKEKPLATAGGVITLLFLITAIFGDVMAPYGMNEIHPREALAPPSVSYLLGTDHLGRDMLSRVILGARVSVIVSLSATTISVLLSTILGLLCGFLGGRFDIIVQRIVDAWMCFPGLIVLIVAVTLVGPGIWQIVIVLGLLYGIGGSRVVRSAVIGIRENVYVDAARSIGCSNTSIIMRHILPNIMAPIIILFTTRMPTMILVEASLSFLGLGVPPPQPTWGGLLSSAGRRYMLRSPGLALWPGLCLSIVVYGINMFGDGLRDILDPRLRGGVGRYGMKNKKQG